LIDVKRNTAARDPLFTMPGRHPRFHCAGRPATVL